MDKSFTFYLRETYSPYKLCHLAEAFLSNATSLTMATVPVEQPGVKCLTQGHIGGRGFCL